MAGRAPVPVSPSACTIRAQPLSTRRHLDLRGTEFSWDTIPEQSLARLEALWVGVPLQAVVPGIPCMLEHLMTSDSSDFEPSQATGTSLDSSEEGPSSSTSGSLGSAEVGPLWPPLPAADVEQMRLKAMDRLANDHRRFFRVGRSVRADLDDNPGMCMPACDTLTRADGVTVAMDMQLQHLAYTSSGSEDGASATPEATKTWAQWLDNPLPGDVCRCVQARPLLSGCCSGLARCWQSTACRQHKHLQGKMTQRSPAMHALLSCPRCAARYKRDYVRASQIARMAAQIRDFRWLQHCLPIYHLPQTRVSCENRAHTATCR